MKKVLVFFNSQQVEVVTLSKSLTCIVRNYPNGEEVTLKIMLTGIHSLTGDHTKIYVASDPELTQEEVTSAVTRSL
ncbi:UNVERIFIED_ORG: hypothetical protein QE398_000151 [Atlantibacter sp. SORGH_AS 304]|nr:hypothetical protein [Atlantibacter sp. SORGH_AS_0304]